AACRTRLRRGRDRQSGMILGLPSPGRSPCLHGPAGNLQYIQLPRTPPEKGRGRRRDGGTMAPRREGAGNRCPDLPDPPPPPPPARPAPPPRAAAPPPAVPGGGLFSPRAGPVPRRGPPAIRLAVEGVDRVLRLVIVGHDHEAEAAAPATEPVDDHLAAGDRS